MFFRQLHTLLPEDVKREIVRLKYQLLRQADTTEKSCRMRRERVERQLSKTI